MPAVAPPWQLTFISAELFFLLVRSNDLKNLAKRKEQRTAREQNRVTRGLLRSLLVECVVFVPASAVLLLLLAPAVVPAGMPAERIAALYAAFGIASYGFPFGAVKAVVTRIALNTIKEFATISHSGVEDESV